MQAAELAVISSWCDGATAAAGHLHTDGVTLWRHCTPVAWKETADDVKCEHQITLTCGGWATDKTRACVQAAADEVIRRRGRLSIKWAESGQTGLAQALADPAQEVVL